MTKKEIDWEKIREQIESDWMETRKQVVDYISVKYGFSKKVASIIVNYENEGNYRQVKDLMEQHLYKGQEIDIEQMGDFIMRNDEGLYQMSLLDEKNK